MKEPRPYRDESDMDNIRALQVAGRAANNGTYYAHRGDVDWWFYNPPDEADRLENLRLWEDEAGHLLAWGLQTSADNSADFFVHPKLRDSAQTGTMLAWFLDWAEARAKQQGKTTLWNYWVVDSDAVMCAHWQACGYSAKDGGPGFAQSLDREIPNSVLPAGFALGDACTEADLRPRAEATHGAFGIQRPWDAYWQKSLSFFRSRAYVGQNNLFVRSPAGHGTAACTIWFDHENKVGLFEPVGTHPSFQKMGLGKAVMYEGLRRMQAAGMRTAIVGTGADNVAAIALYRSVGFEQALRFVQFEKTLQTANDQ
jgi:ribosomal protein S18 acetylase RimI-like enzyme